MPLPLLLLQNHTFLLLFNLFLSSIFLSFILSLFVLSLPFFCCFIFLWLIFKTLVYTEMEITTFMGRLVLGTSSDRSKVGASYKDSKSSSADNKIDGVIKQYGQESVELNSWALPTLHESDEEEYIKVEAERERSSSYEKDSWQILVPKSSKIEERKPFDEVMSYWKKKEKGEI